MEKELNLVEILKDCPRGTKLYSTMYGEVEIVEIRNNCSIKDPIIYKYKNVDGDYYVGSATADGKFTAFPDGECTLFPSKDQRDWSKFKVEPEMIDGEFYYCISNLTGNRNSFIFIYKKHILYKTKKYVALSVPSSILFKEDDIVTNNENIAELRKATEEEKQQLLDAIKVRNYEWDTNKKVLIKIEPKFDITTFKPFDKVLTRDWDDSVWRCNIYECFDKNHNYPFMTIRGSFKQCIPYNEDTKHLVDKNEKPPEKYINW